MKEVAILTIGSSWGLVLCPKKNHSTDQWISRTIAVIAIYFLYFILHYHSSITIPVITPSPRKFGLTLNPDHQPPAQPAHTIAGLSPTLVMFDLTLICVQTECEAHWVFHVWYGNNGVSQMNDTLLQTQSRPEWKQKKYSYINLKIQEYTF